MNVLFGWLLIGAALVVKLWAQDILRRHGITTRFELASVTIPTTYATEGPYRYLRHPVYEANLVMIAGVGIVALGWWGVVLAIPAVPYYQSKAALEDQVREGRVVV